MIHALGIEFAAVPSSSAVSLSQSFAFVGDLPRPHSFGFLPIPHEGAATASGLQIYQLVGSSGQGCWLSVFVVGTLHVTTVIGSDHRHS